MFAQAKRKGRRHLKMDGERLEELRKDAGLTQEELGQLLNISKHAVSSYERGKSEPSDTIKAAMARYFHVSVDYLLGVTRDPRPHTDTPNVIILSPRLSKQAIQSARDYCAYLESRYTEEKKS